MNSSPALSPLTFVKSLFAKESDAIPNATYYSYARGALITAIQSIKDSKGMAHYPRVWAPSFICDTVFFLLDHYHIEYSCYPITEDLLPDWEYLEHCNFSRNDIFVLVYFFGFPMGISKAKAFCEKKNLVLIEDCAHSIIKSVQPGGIGTHGEAAVFGVRKIILIPNGGFLYMKNMQNSQPPTISHASGIYRHPTKMALQWLIEKLGFRPPGIRYKVNKSVLNTFEDNYDLFNFQESMSAWGKKIWTVTNIDYVLQTRKRNYKIYMDELGHLEQIRIPSTLTSMHKEATPWVFFFFFDDAEWLINTLRNKGIFAGDFPNLHPSIFGNTEYYQDNVMYQKSVTLPVHQDLSEKSVSMIANRVKKILVDYSGRQSTKKHMHQQS